MTLRNSTRHTCPLSAVLRRFLCPLTPKALRASLAAPGGHPGTWSQRGATKPSRGRLWLSGGMAKDPARITPNGALSIACLRGHVLGLVLLGGRFGPRDIHAGADDGFLARGGTDDVGLAHRDAVNE